jgi:hypothetical protein
VAGKNKEELNEHATDPVEGVCSMFFCAYEETSIADGSVVLGT